ncbi:MAG: type III pantothenate kinase [Bacteroidales bacterium]|nr:type III pantothenate kinase [Bacteroidales bacterium]
MPVTNLLIDIGNSNCKAAFGTGGELGDILRSSDTDVTGFILSVAGDREIDVIVLSTVREEDPQMEKRLEARCRKLVVLKPSTKLPVDFQFGFPASTLGSDRLAGALAVAMLFPGKDCIKFDFGTALTVDFIDGDGVFKGGNISLGMTSRFRALNVFTKRLPMVVPGEEVCSFGTNTAQALEAGVVLGMKFEVEGYINKYPGHTIIFTGGDSFYFAEKLKSPIFVVPNLVLVGLALIADYYVQN